MTCCHTFTPTENKNSNEEQQFLWIKLDLPILWMTTRSIILE